MRLMPCRRLHSEQTPGESSPATDSAPAAVGGAAAEVVPLPSHAVAAQASHDAPPASCHETELAIGGRLRLGRSGGMRGDDAVRARGVWSCLTAVVLRSIRGTLRCGMAEAIVRWVRRGIWRGRLTLERHCAGIDNYASYLRGRNISSAHAQRARQSERFDIRLVRLG